MNPTVSSLIVAAFSILLTAVLAFVVRLGTKMAMMEKSIIRLETQVSPLWANVQTQIARDLHHPHPRYFEMDKLLEKLEALTITPQERARLKVLLQERSVDMHADITDSQRTKAELMLKVMDIVVLEPGREVPEDR